MLFAYHVDFDGNEAQNILLETVATSGGVEKQLGYHPDGYLTYHNGDDWVRPTAKFATTVGDGVLKIHTVTHNLNTEDVAVSVIDPITKLVVLPKITIQDANNIIVEFSKTQDYRIVVTG